MAVPRVRRAEILIVEDNPGDIRLMQEALKGCDFPHRLNIFHDGAEAIAYLREAGANGTGKPRPDLIFLDLKLPKKDGTEILAEIKQHEELKHTPVIILTSSHSDQDILRCYQLHANCYITKPLLFEDLQHVVNAVKEFWFGIVRLPKK